MKTAPQILLVLVTLISVAAKAQQGSFDFIENKGQWDSRVKYMGDIGSGAFFLQQNGFTVLLHNPEDIRNRMGHAHGAIAATNTSKASKSNSSNAKIPEQVDDAVVVHSHAYRVSFLGGSDAVQIIPEKVQESVNNYFIGNDKSKWASNCKIFKAITYRNIYPGIDLHYYPDNGMLKYDIIVNPGANTADIAMKYEGADKLSIKNGQLIINTSVGAVTELYPYTYQFDNTKGKTEISCKYEIVNGNTVKFKVQNYSKDLPLIIDPTLIFSTFSGSRADNWGFTATPGPDGSLFGGGIVFASGYPLSAGAFQTSFMGPGGNNGVDVGITRFSPTGTSRIYSTYLGGNGNDFPCSLVADGQSNLVIMGRTYSTDFPTSGPSVIGSGGGSDLFVTKLNASGSALIGSMRIGGKNPDAVNIEEQRLGTPRRISTLRFYGDDDRGEVILDRSNNIYLTTQTKSTDFPIVGGFQSTNAGGQDGLILKIDPTCNNIIFSSYIGGSKDDGAFVIDISPITGNLYVAGATSSTDFPGSKAGVKQGTFVGGETDGFVSEIAPDGSAILRTTYLGTSSYDAIYGIKFDKLGYPYVMGVSEGSWELFNASYSNAGSKQFVSKLKPDLSAYVYSTVFGTNSAMPNISPVAFLVDRCENVYISGWGGWIQPGNGGDPFGQAGTNGMPISPGAIKSITDNKDFYFIVLKKNVTGLLYATFFGQGGAGVSGFGEHVDGGTSRYDQQGVIYQAICANCEGNSYGTPSPAYYTSPGVVSPNNGAGNNGCNLGVVKIAFNFAGVKSGVKSFINGVPDSVGCVPLTVEFKDTIRNAVSYEWNFGDGSPQLATTNFDVSHTYNSTGVYKVMLVAIDSTTCNIRDTSYATVKAGNNQAFLSFTNIKLQPCQSLSYQFTNTSTISATAVPFSANSFIWDFGDGSARVVTGTAAIAHSFVSPGTYKVRLVLSDTNYCNSPDSVSVDLRVAPLVKAKFTTPPAGCSPYNALFTNTSEAGQSFAWDFGDGSTSTDVNPTHPYLNPGTYTITLVATDPSTCNKVDQTSFTITVSPKPTAAFTYSPLTAQPNFPYTFTNASSPDAIRFNWIFGDGEILNTSSRASFDHQYNKTGSFNACLAATNATGCTDTVCKTLQNIIEPRLDVPNAFTPLANANNAVIYVKGFGIGRMKWRIYNRFGNLVFESDNQGNGWDGKYKGSVQPMDVYAYTLEVEFTDGTKASKKGDITLLR